MSTWEPRSVELHASSHKCFPCRLGTSWEQSQTASRFSSVCQETESNIWPVTPRFGVGAMSIPSYLSLAHWRCLFWSSVYPLSTHTSSFALCASRALVTESSQKTLAFFTPASRYALRDEPHAFRTCADLLSSLRHLSAAPRVLVGSAQQQRTRDHSMPAVMWPYTFR